MAKGLTTKKIAELEAAFLETGSIAETARICKVHHLTAKSYVEKNGWEQLRAEKLAQVKAAIAEKYPDRVIDTLMEIQIYKDYINVLRDDGELNCSIKDYIELVKLELMLTGEFRQGENPLDGLTLQIYNMLGGGFNGDSPDKIKRDLKRDARILFSEDSSTDRL